MKTPCDHCGTHDEVRAEIRFYEGKWGELERTRVELCGECAGNLEAQYGDAKPAPRALRPPMDFPEDVARIQRVMKDFGTAWSKVEALWIWEDYSAWMCAGWMQLPDSDEALLKTLLVHASRRMR